MVCHALDLPNDRSPELVQQHRSTRRWIEITRTSRIDAHDVVIEPAGDNSRLHRIVGEFPTTIHALQTRSFPALYVWGGEAPAMIRIRWTEDGQPQEREYHV